eukprot:TRINITY_DN35334_c0_g1_i1.p1 TRINITY_DN35334_c0_g1~~TRINITY_DN35334_c0_g1_i1.p1  ORF type:complete len:624 (+),score=199.73 TRINITY_DN35334_c0_g1_i1:69-1874(+)
MTEAEAAASAGRESESEGGEGHSETAAFVKAFRTGRPAATVSGEIALAHPTAPGEEPQLRFSPVAGTERSLAERLRIEPCGARSQVAGVQTSRRAPRLRLALRGAPPGSAFVFEFNSAAERDHFLHALSEACGTVTQLAAGGALGSHLIRVVAQGDAAAAPGLPPVGREAALRGAALAASESLRRLWEEVVVERAWVTEDEFWEGRDAGELAGDAGRAQPVGPRSAHFQHELLQLTGQRAQRGARDTYRLNEAVVRDIFHEYPEVRELYNAHVSGSQPPQLSEKDFWRQFLLSSYFRTRGRKGKKRAADSIFDEAIARRHEAEHSAPLQRTADPTCALDDTLGNKQWAEGYGLRRRVELVGNDASPEPDAAPGEHGSGERRSKLSEGEHVMRHFNRHGMRVLSGAGAGEAAAGYDAQLAARTALQDLRGPAPAAAPAEPSPGAKRSRAAQAGGGALGAAVAAAEAAAAAAEAPPQEGPPDLPAPGAVRAAEEALLRAEAAAAQGPAEEAAAAVADPELQGRAAAACELLRHFWRAATSPGGAAQAAALAAHGDRLLAEVRGARRKRPRDDPSLPLWDQLIEAIETAGPGGQRSRQGGWAPA